MVVELEFRLLAFLHALVLFADEQDEADDEEDEVACCAAAVNVKGEVSGVPVVVMRDAAPIIADEDDGDVEVPTSRRG